MFLQTVIEVVNFCFQSPLQSETDCCQTKWQI